MPKTLTVWITTDWKILKEMGIPDHLTCLLRNLYAGQEATVRTRHGKMDWTVQSLNGSKLGKGYVRAVYCHPAYLTYIHSFVSGQTTGREHTPPVNRKADWRFTGHGPAHQNKTQFPPQPLILHHQRTDRLKTTITENQPTWSHGPQPCLTQWNYEPCRVGPPKTDGSWWRGLTKRGPLEKGMANHFSILALRTPWTVWNSTSKFKSGKNLRCVGNVLLSLSYIITEQSSGG